MVAGSLGSFPAGERVFADSNILTYHLLGDPVHGGSCRAFIARVEEGEVEGWVSPIVVSETVFNFIKASVVKRYRVRAGDVLALLKSQPEILSSIELEPVVDLLEIFSLMPVGKREVEESYRLIGRYQLLTNDALHAACCKTNGIENIATNDSDFERVENLKVWKP